jgi:hypothetical protein
MSLQSFSKPSVNVALWAADKVHQPHEVRAYLSSLGIDFIPCLGAYNGDTELSYCTSEADFWRIAPQLCEHQESVLILGSMDSRARRAATLKYLVHGDLSTRPGVNLGRLYSVPLHVALERGNWTMPLQQIDKAHLIAFVTDHVNKFGDALTWEHELAIGRKSNEAFAEALAIAD